MFAGTCTGELEFIYRYTWEIRWLKGEKNLSVWKEISACSNLTQYKDGYPVVNSKGKNS